ncbi:MAG: 50S ribosomal protein L4 [Acidobacteria bacterium]|nr:50S ribosomal protein L4 [Acidobacteriota bacterium]
MPVLDVKNLQNEIVGQLELEDSVFGVELRETLIWEAVRHYMAVARRGTHSTKTRTEVRGSTRKLWRQKGTGRARVGGIRSPLWRHGGTIFGPKPRDYSYRFPRKKRVGALRSALSEKIRQDQILVVDSLELPTHKTKEFVKLVDGLGLERKLLVVDNPANTNAVLSSRNLPRVKFVPESGVNIYDVLNYDQILFTRGAILQLQEVLRK